MSLPALFGFAGVLVAAVATGLLAGRAVRQPRLDTILWTAGTLALTVALAAQSMGFASGFGPATFRAVQLFALLLAPLWLAWGLVERVWPGEAARFGTRLACGALTVVGSVILVTDPLTAAPFGKGWPLAGSHYQAPSQYTLDVVQAVAVILAAASIGLPAAQVLADTLDRATGTFLDQDRSPGRKLGTLDNRGSHFYLALYWAQELAKQTDDAEIAAAFTELAQTLAANESTIVEELLAVQGKPADIGGYYLPDAEKTAAVMRPSKTFNEALAAL